MLDQYYVHLSFNNNIEAIIQQWAGYMNQDFYQPMWSSPVINQPMILSIPFYVASYAPINPTSSYRF